MEPSKAGQAGKRGHRFARRPGQNLRNETVNVGLPLPPGFLTDANLVRIYGDRGQEIEAAVRSLERWRIDGREGSIRSIQIRFQADSRVGKTQQVKAAFGRPRTRSSQRLVKVVYTLIQPDGMKSPRVLAPIPAKWLCDSWVAGRRPRRPSWVALWNGVSLGR